jgi:arylsulfatase B
VYEVYGGISGEYLNSSFSLLPEYLKSCCEYSSHAIGKWHLGMNKKSVLPQSRGFDTHFGYLSGAEDHITHIASSSNAPAVDFFEGYSPSVKYDNVFSTPLFTERAIQIIEKFGNKSTESESQPLFLYLSYQDAHWPQQAPQGNHDICTFGY